VRIEHLLSSVLYHWASRDDLDGIQRRGLLPRRGGFLGFHSDDPAVYLAIEGDCTKDFNPAVVLADAPLRVEVAVGRLKPELFAADLNALLDPQIIFIARRKTIDLFDPECWTLENSLAFAGCARYRGSIPPHVLELTAMDEPEQIHFSAAYRYQWSDTERSELIQVLDRLGGVARSHAGDPQLVGEIFRPLRDWANTGDE
jgi:hypothetical protein